jgi:hypothetical protein
LVVSLCAEAIYRAGVWIDFFSITACGPFVAPSLASDLSTRPTLSHRPWLLPSKRVKAPLTSHDHYLESRSRSCCKGRGGQRLTESRLEILASPTTHRHENSRRRLHCRSPAAIKDERGDDGAGGWVRATVAAVADGAQALP